ncbi:hypothetical protein [uncultured Sphingomonas sp.]|uniref:hypothetical protein n=1 Tax=uncultured Sphingomonas sp. TaxID=158754 RepID=UPI0025D65746|nr:hypothetical protein [uncultured Sphingomonas sp.]
MHPNEKPRARDTWFVYSRKPGKITAMPVNGKGWLGFIACLALVLFVGLATARWAGALHPVFGTLALAAVNIVGILPIIRLAIVKGRPE